MGQEETVWQLQWFRFLVSDMVVAPFQSALPEQYSKEYDRVVASAGQDAGKVFLSAVATLEARCSSGGPGQDEDYRGHPR